MNGASDLMVTAFGDRGRHARTTVGVAVLPLDAAVEVEGDIRGVVTAHGRSCRLADRAAGRASRPA